ncbi:hypothetical protein HPB52_025213 [Rhipicephalus sanguineus]|uniref:Uncharacterized protein n=1 Tax=Rhipicephalus sanguineus TaxID=34632 RepID=A0A9D4TDB8_RHISA|nr:hypothetical protein HPB52_025213 [Rhipicephalus sanguineus]
MSRRCSADSTLQQDTQKEFAKSCALRLARFYREALHLQIDRGPGSRSAKARKRQQHAALIEHALENKWRQELFVLRQHKRPSDTQSSGQREAAKEAADSQQLGDERQIQILQLKLKLQEGAQSELSVPAAAVTQPNLPCLNPQKTTDCKNQAAQQVSCVIGESGGTRDSRSLAELRRKTCVAIECRRTKNKRPRLPVDCMPVVQGRVLGQVAHVLRDTGSNTTISMPNWEHQENGAAGWQLQETG